MTTATTEALKLTDRINRIEPSATMAVVAEADKLRAQGIDVVDFGAGEPHFSTPQHIKDAAIAAIEAGQTKYTAVNGTPELRRAIIEHVRRRTGIGYGDAEVSVSGGAKQVIHLALAATLDRGRLSAAHRPHHRRPGDVRSRLRGFGDRGVDQRRPLRSNKGALR